MQQIKQQGKRVILPLAGGGLAYLFSGIALLGVIFFGAIFAFQWFRNKQSFSSNKQSLLRNNKQSRNKSSKKK
jgi:hypothetical protein